MTVRKYGIRCNFGDLSSIKIFDAILSKGEPMPYPLDLIKREVQTGG